MSGVNEALMREAAFRVVSLIDAKCSVAELRPAIEALREAASACSAAPEFDAEAEAAKLHALFGPSQSELIEKMSSRGFFDQPIVIGEIAHPPADSAWQPEGAASRIEPPPTVSTDPNAIDIQTLVIRDIEERRQFGIAKYGTALFAHNGRDARVDAYQEALDLVVYLRQEIEQGPPNYAEKLRKAGEGRREAESETRRAMNDLQQSEYLLRARNGERDIDRNTIKVLAARVEGLKDQLAKATIKQGSAANAEEGSHREVVRLTDLLSEKNSLAIDRLAEIEANDREIARLDIECERLRSVVAAMETELDRVRTVDNEKIANLEEVLADRMNVVNAQEVEIDRFKQELEARVRECNALRGNLSSLVRDMRKVVNANAV